LLTKARDWIERLDVVIPGSDIFTGPQALLRLLRSVRESAHAAGLAAGRAEGAREERARVVGILDREIDKPSVCQSGLESIRDAIEHGWQERADHAPAAQQTSEGQRALVVTNDEAIGGAQPPRENAADELLTPPRRPGASEEAGTSPAPTGEGVKPDLVRCERCGGNGEEWSYNRTSPAICRDCNGLGRRVPAPPPAEEPKACAACNGTGRGIAVYPSPRAAKRPCDACNGTGLGRRPEGAAGEGR